MRSNLVNKLADFGRAMVGIQTRSTMEQYLIARHAANTMTAGVAVTNKTAAGIPAVRAAVSFAAEAIAQLTMRVWSGEGPLRTTINNGWQAEILRGVPNPTQSWFQFWETVQSSLDYRGNAYIWKSKNAAGRVVALTALHPDQVTPYRWSTTESLVYPVSFTDLYPTPPEFETYGSVTADKKNILHIRGRGGTGELVAPSPIKEFAASLGIALAKQQHENSLFARGAGGGLGVEFPSGVSPKQADEWRDVFDSKHAGPFNAGRTKVVGGGAQMKVIGMTQAEAQFAESSSLSVLDVSRIFSVPAWFLGIDQKVEKAASPEHEQQRWVKHGLGPRMARIESAVNADPDLFLTPRYYAAFDTAGLIRGDLLTEADISLKKVQSGQWLVDEARAKDGLPPLPDGAGQVPQIVPVGGGPNPTP